MKAHWTERSVKDYLFRIAADFISQLEKKMELQNITQDKLAERMGITKGRVSQLFNHPGNITLGNVIKFSRTLGMKVSIVAYEDGDTKNEKGPIDSEIFTICWEKLNKPRDFWAIQEFDRKKETASNIIEDERYIPPESIVVTSVINVYSATNVYFTNGIITAMALPTHAVNHAIGIQKLHDSVEIPFQIIGNA